MNNTDNSNKVYKVDYSRTFLNQEIYNRELEENNNSKVKRTAVIYFLIFIIMVLGVFIFVDSEGFSSKIFGEESNISQAFSNEKKQHANFPCPFGMKRQNILLLGVDDNPEGKDMWSGTRTDTIILVNIDPKSKSINAISIPRDSKVFLAGNKGINKINSAHAIGGVEMTKNTIEKTLGVRINRYVLVHEDIVKELVDVLGGVEIYIEKPMHYRDRTAHLNINFDKGLQKLDGQKAIEYLRFRHDALGDIGRTQRQQWFIRGLVKTLQNPQTLTKVPDLITTAKKYIKTDISTGEMAHLIEILRHLDLSKTEIATLPGQPNQSGYISYWILDPEKTQEVVDRLIYRDRAKIAAADKPIVANVMYAKDYKSKANAIIDELKNQGIDVKCIDVVNRSHAQFIAHSNRITNDYFNILNEKVQNIDKIQFVYDPINLYCAATDFTIIVAAE